MSGPPPLAPGSWTSGDIPDNVEVGINSIITGEGAFRRFRSRQQPALIIGAHCTMDAVQFAVGAEGHVEIGDYCYFTNVVLLCELEVRIGSYVVIGWHTTITDTDFHPVAPAERIADAVSQSPLGKGRPRPDIPRLPVVIDDNAWIGPNVTILKGVHIGAEAFIEPGAMVTRDVLPRTRVAGNPAQIIGDASS